MNLPTDIANQALDAIGADVVLGDIEDGSKHAQVLLRAYQQCLMQLLRAANWDFARKTAPMTLLADATGQTPDVGALVPVPWIYEYAYPTDCMKVRFVPWNYCTQGTGAPAGNIQIPNTPLFGQQGQQPLMGQRLRPARFTIATDYNYPPLAGQITWEVQGVSPQGRTVVLTNVKEAQVVYTALQLYPSTWDSLFRAAFVAYLASEVALPLSRDKKFGFQVRAAMIQTVKQKLMEARLVDGNEGVYSSDIRVDWMSIRRNGGGFGHDHGIGGDGPGVWGFGHDSLGFSDGSAY